MYNVIVKDGKRRTYPLRAKLFALGLQFKQKGKYVGYWTMVTNDYEKVILVQEFCYKEKLIVEVIPRDLKRSNNYRQLFYKNYKPLLDEYYICAYCLLPYKKESITVDHIIPAGRAYKNNFCLKLMKWLKITNINDVRNLAPSCKSCNAKKQHKIGLWTLRGFLGRSGKFAFFVWTIILIMFIILTVISFGYGG